MKRHLSFIAALGTWCLASNTTAYSQQVRANPGSIAIGGNVTGSTVIIGIPQEKVDELVREAKRSLEELTAQQRENIALLKEKLDINIGQVRAALSILGESDVPLERLTSKLVEIAERFKDLQVASSALSGDSSTIVSLKTEAQKAIEVGDLAMADAMLADVEAEQRRVHDRLALNEAETSAQRGGLALTRLRYREAANHFANAAAAFPPSSAHEDKRISYLQQEASALYQLGDERGDKGALLLAIERYRRIAELIPQERAPLEWPKVQNNLAMALFTAGQRESGVTRLEEATAIYRAVLKPPTREVLPLEWATAQSGLGGALQAMGERESGTTKLEEAVFAYREALKERTRDRIPLKWAVTQSKLAGALSSLAERAGGSAKLEEALTAYREVLREWTRERAPLDWSMTQNDLGSVLWRLGRIEQAIAAYREALNESTRERVPIQWAMIQSNLGNALGSAGRLEEAIASYNEALKEYTRERAPLDWATTQNNLGVELRRLGERETGTDGLEAAVKAYREALKERTRERTPLLWAQSFGNEGVALMLIAERHGDAALAATALSQINTAFETMRDGDNAPSAAYYERQLSRARSLVSRLRGR